LAQCASGDAGRRGAASATDGQREVGRVGGEDVGGGKPVKLEIGPKEEIKRLDNQWRVADES
jgi:hypothetical protein